ncbi:MAG: acyl-CoA desaturase [Cytophagaceae bacterium]|nr:acyl-CoA desaturase [Cytophagaceae bacterium]
MAILIFFAIHWYGSLFFQTFFLHRYAAHKAFTMSVFWERVTYVLTFIFQGSNYLSAYGYGVMHRMHHAFADTEKDPHSPKYSTGIFDMMWKTKNIYSDIRDRRVQVEERFTKGVPHWKWFDDFASNNLTRIAWGTAYSLFYIYFVPSPAYWWLFLLLPIHFLMAPVHGAIINWFAHKYGYVTFPVNDTSKNLMPVDVFMMGEGFHNNHHTHGSSPNFAFRWFEIDPTYQIMKVLDLLHIIRLPKANEKTEKKIKSTPVIEAA